MSQINPPYRLRKVRPRNQFSSKQNAYLDELERVLEQTYRRVGGKTDSISVLNTSSEEIEITGSIHKILAKLKQLEAAIKQVDTHNQPINLKPIHDKLKHIEAQL